MLACHTKPNCCNCMAVGRALDQNSKIFCRVFKHVIIFRSRALHVFWSNTFRRFVDCITLFSIQLVFITQLSVPLILLHAYIQKFHVKRSRYASAYSFGYFLFFFSSSFVFCTFANFCLFILFHFSKWSIDVSQCWLV